MGGVLNKTAMRAVHALLFAFLAIQTIAPPPLSAREAFPAGSICHTSDKKSVRVEVRAVDAAGWACEGAEFDWEADRHFIRFDFEKGPWSEEPPRFIEFDRHPFGKLTITALGSDGGHATRVYGFKDTQLGTSSLKSIVELPRLDEPTEAMVMVLDDGYWPEALVQGELVTESSVRATAGVIHLFAALLCGLLLAPMIFDFVFFRALRESFPLFHAVFCIMASLQTAAVSGLLPLVAGLTYEAELIITYLSLDMLVIATFLFALNFLEPQYLTRRHRHILIGITALTLVNGLATTLFPAAFGLWIDHVYFGILLIILAAYFAVLGQAQRGGSKMAPYLIFGFAPLASIVIIQLTSVYVPALQIAFDETWPQNFALLFEVVATALAVAQRFMTLRRERDKALNAARDLEVLSELDDLTGLLNRRALEARYPQLVRQGFHAMAVVDLDQFKSINDLYGHPVGDRVIRSAAWALSPGDEEDMIAFRIGGEEFLLLLRGKAAAQKAEGRRKAVTARIMAEVDEVQFPVTASMGYLDFSAVATLPEADFEHLYAHGDRLLYAAKCAGRNRTFSETLEDVEPAAASPRSAAA